VRDGEYVRELEELTEPLRRSDVDGDAGREETAEESEDPEADGGEPAAWGVAAEADGVVAGHKMAGARDAGGFDEQLAVGADGLEAVVFDDYGFAGQEAEKDRQDGGAGYVRDVGGADQLPKFKQ
jgi:hypothetical protein